MFSTVPLLDDGSREVTVLLIIKLNKFPVLLCIRCGSGKLKLCHYFTIFAILKSVEHSFEDGETPSYSASHQARNYVQRI